LTCIVARDRSTHGGLTPAALVNGRPCIADLVNFRWAVALCNKSGRRKPTVRYERRLQVIAAPRGLRSFHQTHGGLTPAALVNGRSCTAESSFFRRTVVVRPPGAGGVSPPWHVSIHGRQDTLALAGAIPEPRRANARRSCELAFVHRRCRYFSVGCSVVQQERSA
jgi:hypothetical protein